MVSLLDEIDQQGEEKTKYPTCGDYSNNTARSKPPQPGGQRVEVEGARCDWLRLAEKICHLLLGFLWRELGRIDARRFHDRRGFAAQLRWNGQLCVAIWAGHAVEARFGLNGRATGGAGESGDVLHYESISFAANSTNFTKGKIRLIGEIRGWNIYRATRRCSSEPRPKLTILLP
jgi:hypothetical protein